MSFLCIHGHFYQPPRENPWTGEIDRQESAAPYHDWNERITAECYAANADPGPRDGSADGRFPSNYSRISFDFGPTLLSWLERKAAGAYRTILEADRESRERFSGHGSAVAQAYNHMILPLANSRDKRTQVIWGIRDFEHRFRRPPEGMWLPETAVDFETLEILAEQSIRFTILSPRQALRFRAAGEKSWREAGDGFETRRPFKVPLASGKSIAIFFYNGAASHAVAFGALEAGGEPLAARLAGLMADAAPDELASIATDGETYGHHFRGGERALAAALDAIQKASSPRLTNYAEFLAARPPRHEVEIAENTAWSCVHGLGRWSTDCGCKTGEHPEWSQAWRGTLREAFDWLRDRLCELYEARAAGLLSDPWRAREDSIELWLNPAAESVNRFLQRHAARPLAQAEQIQVLDLLDMQRHAMLMYTSCGWFFDDVGGLEGRQVLQYAGRAVEIADRVLGSALEEPFLRRLEGATSNLPERRNARCVYEETVRTALQAASTKAE